MPADDVVAALETRFGATRFPLGVEVAPDDLLATMRILRDAYGYRFYILATAVERNDAFDLLHAVRHSETADEIFVRVRLPKDRPRADSAAFVYAGAEWHEREVLDLFGIEFRGHPDPRRILLPDEYVGHPLRKDFPMDAPWGYRPAARERDE
jgi:NADH:ubiquinone oxidoreductase subunit C